MRYERASNVEYDQYLMEPNNDAVDQSDDATNAVYNNKVQAVRSSASLAVLT